MAVADWFEAEFATVPTTSGGVWTWIIVIMAGYLVLAFVLKAVQRRSPISDKVVANVPVMIWNAGTFATSVMLLIGISDHPEVLRVIGDTTPFLLFVAFMGLVYGFIGLVRPD